ncbi:type III pantothenate kinase [Lacinutrix neustonica]|uniref:Type III pantothenate kinase n=1 Tax=Lacinutrix neustonica TaxID=2980107 RepID=A0A9E8MU63_9FLAO|nr:type III pantothenate kinase [Lacinutrix neustonica]WAC01421.1 type III pantothenate kinase [Lacinutrix neustonica]
MNLIIDVGNSFTKLAVFEQSSMFLKVRVETEDCVKEIKKLQHIYEDFELAIVSSVGKLDEKAANFLKKVFRLQILTHETKLPFKSLYATPKTLGIDRIALVCASVDQFPDRNVLIIDAGTCITFDFINANNEYLGGAISPGIRMRYKAMHNQTANLPLLLTEIPNHIIGNSTANAMHSGVWHGVINEIDGNIERYLEKYSDLTVILTGGDTKMLSKQLKSSIFADSDFLLKGLNFILQHNSL